MNPDSPVPVPGDAQALARKLRARVRDDPEPQWMRDVRRVVRGHLSSSIDRLRASTVLLRKATDQIGLSPPTPSTVRGRIGALFVRVVQRAIFWYTPSVQDSNHKIINALEAHLNATEEILNILERTNIEVVRIARLRDAADPHAELEATPRDM